MVLKKGHLMGTWSGVSAVLLTALDQGKNLFYNCDLAMHNYLPISAHAEVLIARLKDLPGRQAEMCSFFASGSDRNTERLVNGHVPATHNLRHVKKNKFENTAIPQRAGDTLLGSVLLEVRSSRQRKRPRSNGSMRSNGERLNTYGLMQDVRQRHRIQLGSRNLS